MNSVALSAFRWEDWYAAVGGRTIHISEVNAYLERIREDQGKRFEGPVARERRAFASPEGAANHLKQKALDFGADILRICLFNPKRAGLASEEVRWVDRKDEGVQQFQVHLEKEHTVCGRLNDSKLEFLFGAKARWVQSTALVPLGEKGADGMMAIGSSDPGRFYPGMGTLFLDLLADVISSSLDNASQEEERLSA